VRARPEGKYAVHLKVFHETQMAEKYHKMILSLDIPVVYVTMKAKIQLNLLARLQLWC